MATSQVARVHYPGLESHPEHHIAKRQMTGYGGVISFEVRLASPLVLILALDIEHCLASD